MKQIAIYDFDKTLIPYDSGSRFAFFCALRYPWCIPFAPVVGVFAALCVANILPWDVFKKICFYFMPFIPRERAIKRFWDKHEKDVYQWFKDRPREALVISASPDFLLEELQKRIGFEGLICTRHNYKTGAIIGKNCARQEKVSRFYEEIDQNEVEVIDVYSDSLKNDKPIFSLATNKCYHIIDGNKNEFNYKDKFSEEL